MGSTSTTDSQSLMDTLMSYESLVLDMKAEVLIAYERRCAITESECANLHLDACRSRFPEGECTHDEVLEICEDQDCGMIRDFKNPSVRLPDSVATGTNLNPTDGNAIETMCYSVLLNTPLRELYDRASLFGSNAVYFGAWTGVFRYFPGIAQASCGDYDPRIRPWYVAASSGPKDVVIVLDVSGSMSAYGRLDLAKEAAVTVINTLNADSFVNIVAFSESARVLMPNATTLVRANADNAAELVDLVQDLEFDLSQAGTNFGTAFNLTFDILEESRLTDGASAQCQTAIVFLTDGKITIGASADETIAAIDERNEAIGAQVFSYSLGPLADKVTAKQIACDAGGIYEHVEDGGDLSQAMAFFYRFYAIGLGENEDFAAVTDIYEFATNQDQGFTIAAPVYDTNSTSQPVFLGVVAMDFKLSTFLDQGYTEEQVSEALQRSNEWCPELELDECSRQVFRSSISSLSVCDGVEEDCMNGTSLEPVRCMEESEYPTDLWENTDFEGLDYVERTCCGSNYSNSVLEPSCTLEVEVSESGGSAGAGEVTNIGVGLAGGVAVAVALILGAMFFVQKQKRKNRWPKRDRNFTVAAAVGPPENAPRDLDVDPHQ